MHENCGHEIFFSTRHASSFASWSFLFNALAFYCTATAEACLPPWFCAELFIFRLVYIIPGGGVNAKLKLTTPALICPTIVVRTDLMPPASTRNWRTFARYHSRWQPLLRSTSTQRGTPASCRSPRTSRRTSALLCMSLDTEHPSESGRYFVHEPRYRRHLEV